MYKNPISLIVLIFSIVNISAQQTLVGTTTDQETDLPLAYVNIGIPLKNVGTVSDASGSFTLSIEEAFQSDTLVFSILGYEPLHMPIASLKEKAVIRLSPKSYTLSPVEILSESRKQKTVGNTSTAKNMILELGGNKLGNELGSLIRIKKGRAILQNFQVNIVKNPYSKVKFRLNLYHVKGGQPDTAILQENIIVEFKRSKGMLTVDLSAYDIIVESDFIISLEWIEELGKKAISFSAAKTGPPIFVRNVSQGKWQRIDLVTIGMHLDVSM